MARYRSILLGALLALALAPTGCSTEAPDAPSSSALRDDAITVGSFDFAESELLAEMYSQALEAGGYDVEREFGLGPREIVAPALTGGLVELVPEYAGTALDFLSLGAARPQADVAATHDALVTTLAATPQVTALAAAPAQDANAFVVTPETAERFGLTRLSDVAAVAEQLTFAGPPECASRPFCLVGLEDVYGIHFDDVVFLDTGGRVTRQALVEGFVDIALLFSSDPSVGAGAYFVELVDDRSLQPAENVTPLVRTEVVDRWGQELIDVVDAVSRELTTDDLRDLNGAVERGDGSAAALAADWLERKGLR